MLAAFKPTVLTKLMIVGRRAPLNRTPKDIGCAYEDVTFTSSTDDVKLRGWFIPSGAAEPGPVVAFVHGWLWNRLGNVAGQVPVPDKDVDFLPATKALHDAGYHVLLFDLRNHGESGRKLPITYGVWEAYDVQGALELPAHPRRRRQGPHRPAGLLDGRQRLHLRDAGLPAGEGDPGRPGHARGALQPQLLARRDRQARADAAQAGGPDVQAALPRADAEAPGPGEARGPARRTRS